MASQRRGSLAGAPCRGAGGGGTGGEQRTTAPPRQAADMARGEGHHPPRDGGSATQRCHDGDGGERNVRDGERTDLSPRQVEIADINLVTPQTRPRGVRDGVPPYTITTPSQHHHTTQASDRRHQPQHSFEFRLSTKSRYCASGEHRHRRRIEGRGTAGGAWEGLSTCCRAGR